MKEKNSIAATKLKLPIYDYKSEICDKLSSNEVLLIISETGSGKSTQIPQYIHNQNPNFSICITQPRRVAAITVSKRVSQEMNVELGSAVGYRVRFDDCSNYKGEKTKILYSTDGMLLRESMSDVMLSNYNIVILDEAHERSLQTDILFGVVKRAMEYRKKDSKERLKVIIMSATLDEQTFVNFFPQAIKIKVPGRMYPVQILYTREPQEDYIDAALLTILEIISNSLESEKSDVLVFLPGQEEIEDLSSLLSFHLRRLQNEKELKKIETGEKKDIFQRFEPQQEELTSNQVINNIHICHLYAALPPEQQMVAFQPSNYKKVILATNIAETSITLQNIKYVIDTGKCKIRSNNPTTGMESLFISNISQAQANQRSGRAGRTSDGYCFRLYTQEGYDSLEPVSEPEILRVNLSQVMLQLKSMKINDPIHEFDFITPPNTTAMIKAFELLYVLGCLDKANLELTPKGIQMSLLPLDPIFANLVLLSKDYDCIKEMLIVVSMLSVENLFHRTREAGDAHKRFQSYEGDFCTLLSVYEYWCAESYSTNKRKKYAGTSGDKIPHRHWCQQNFINGRALLKARDTFHQLLDICTRSTSKHGLGWDKTFIKMHHQERTEEELIQFLKCVCAGLFLQSASRNVVLLDNTTKKRNKYENNIEGRYRTKVGSKDVFIHPTSSMFGRNPPPKCVVYTDLLVTKKTYIRGVTQIREEWLSQVAPDFFDKVNND